MNTSSTRNDEFSVSLVEKGCFADAPISSTVFHLLVLYRRRDDRKELTFKGEG